MAATDVVRGVDNQTSGTSAATGVFITLSAPAGTVAGDQLLVGIELREPASTLTGWTAPAGWTLVANPTQTSGSAYVYRATYGTGVTGSSWTWSNGTGNTTTTRWAASLVALKGSSAGGYQTGSAASVSGATVTSPSITTTGSTLLVAFFGSRTTGGPSFTWPAAWVDEGDVNTGTSTNSASHTVGVYNTTPATAGTYSVTVTPSLSVSAGYGAIVAYTAATNTGTATAAFSGTGSLTATATPALKATAAFSATGTFATGIPPRQVSASVSGTGTLSATATSTFPRLAITVTPEPANSPPRVRIDIADTRTVKATQVTVTRTDEAGNSSPVRTADGGPLLLSAGAGTLYDYEAPGGQALVYMTDVVGGPTATARLNMADPWLVHPGIPTRSMRIVLRKGSNATEDDDLQQGVFPILGRTNPIVVTSGARQASMSTLLVSLETAGDRAALKQLLADGAPLFLNVPDSMGLDIDSGYVVIGKAGYIRRSDVGTDVARDVTLPYQIVDRPAGGTQAAFTWADISATTWTGIPAKSWNALSS